MGLFALMPNNALAIDEINVGFFYEWPAPAVVAAAKGKYEKAVGLPVYWHPFETSEDMNRGLSNGDIQIAFAHEIIPFMRGFKHGLNAVITGVAVSYPEYDLCVARKKSNIDLNDPDQFVGRTIATIEGAQSHFRMLKALEILTVDSDKMDIVFKGYGADVAKTLYRDTADIGCAYGVPLNNMYKKGDPIVSGEQLELNGVKLFDAITMSRTFLDNNRVLAEKFMEVVAKMNEQYLSKPWAMKKDMANTSNLNLINTHRILGLLQFLTVDQQLSQSWLGHDGEVQKYMIELSAFLHSHGKLEVPLAVDDQFIDSSLLKR